MNSIAVTEPLSAVDEALEVLLQSEDPIEFCKAVVHAEFSSTNIQGAHLLSIDDSSHFHQIASYGLGLNGVDESTMWSDNGLGKAVRSKSSVHETKTELVDSGSLYVLPLMRNKLPIGCLALVLGAGSKEAPLVNFLEPIVSKVGAYLVSLTRPNGQGLKRTAGDPEDLTSRQIKIIELMAEGLVNAEIAKELLLSESTIRQETVRIYRALGVPNRTEAAKKARNLGLIKRPPPRLIEEFRRQEEILS